MTKLRIKNEPRDVYAYRGYLVHRNPFNDLFYVSQGGAHIATCVDRQSARKAIDSIAGPR